MANDLNKVVLIGRLTRDPELKQIGETTVGKFSLAVGSSYKKGNEKVDETSFFDCEVWGKLADVLGQYATKGKQIAIEGKLKQDTWDTQDGKKASKVKIRVENFQLLGGKSDSPSVPNSIEEMGSEVQDDSVF
jgi:single-strand DNA-binding protein